MECWNRKMTRRHERRCFASLRNAYLCGLKCLERLGAKHDYDFYVTGEKFERTETYAIEDLMIWSRKPFHRMDCEEVTWYFDKKGELYQRQYEYGGAAYDYMPVDAEVDAGTHFKPGDLIKCDALWWGKKPKRNKDIVYVVTSVPGRKRDNRWENYYTVLEVTKGDDGSVGTMHTHPHESSMIKFDSPVDKSGPLWFLHQVFSKKIRLTKKQIGALFDNNLELVRGKWTGVERSC